MAAPRVEIPEVVLSGGQPVSGASVQVNNRGAGAATVFAAEVGGTAAANPIITDVNGRIEGWLEEGSYDLVVSATGLTTYTQPYEAVRGNNSPGKLATVTGDLIYASSANNIARLGIGSTGQVLSVAGGVPTWSPVSTQAMTQIFDVQVGRGNTGDPAAPAATIDSNTILAGPLPITYNHLRLVLSGRGDAATTNQLVQMRLNNDSGANYGDQRGENSNGTTWVAAESSSANSAIVGRVGASTATAGAAGQMVVDILNYNGTTFWKTFNSFSTLVLDITASGKTIDVVSGGWKSTSAISRIAVFPASGNFVTGTRASLYGVL